MVLSPLLVLWGQEPAVTGREASSTFLGSSCRRLGSFVSYLNPHVTLPVYDLIRLSSLWIDIVIDVV